MNHITFHIEPNDQGYQSLREYIQQWPDMEKVSVSIRSDKNSNLRRRKTKDGIFIRLLKNNGKWNNEISSIVHSASAIKDEAFSIQYDQSRCEYIIRSSSLRGHFYGISEFMDRSTYDSPSLSNIHFESSPSFSLRMTQVGHVTEEEPVESTWTAINSPINILKDRHNVVVLASGGLRDEIG